jgi:hypothetical protein
MAEGEFVAQLVGGDEAVRSSPLPAGGGIVLEPFLEIRKGHWISVNANILREKTRECFKTCPFQIAIGIFKRSGAAYHTWYCKVLKSSARADHFQKVQPGDMGYTTYLRHR